MDKQLKLKNKILKVLPKAAAMRFQNHSFSPRMIHKSRSENTRHNKGLYAPMVSMIPHETKKKDKLWGNNDIDYQEPTSPKISCMGQIKHDKKRVTKAKTKDVEVKKNVSTFKKMLFYAAKPKTVSSCNNKNVLVERVPSMSHIKRFTSGRDTFANFDWKDQVVPHEVECCCSDEDRVDESDDEGKVEGFIVPFSAPILVSSGKYEGVIHLKPRKEINLWKRRTMAQPRPLQFE